MVKVCEDEFPKTGGFYMDGYLKTNLDIIYEAVTTMNHDCVLLIDGHEGFGKSVLGQQIGYYLARCNPDKKKRTPFSVDNMKFTPKQFKDAVLAKDNFFHVVVWDEARGGLNSRRAMSETNNMITDMLAEIRQKNLFIVIIMPSFMDMDKNVAVWRSRALIHVIGRGFERGYFNLYSPSKKSKLYFIGKKRYYDYNVVSPSFRGRFGPHMCIDEKEYKKAKLEALRSYKDDEEETNDFLRCPNCDSKTVRYSKKIDMMTCSKCGNEYPRPPINNHKENKSPGKINGIPIPGRNMPSE